MARKTITLETIHSDLEFVREKIIEIAKHMVDIDNILTEDDYKALKEYKKEKSEGKLILHEVLKKELNYNA
ncbi:MAG: hypothetical protein H8D22_04175 [Candidatus Cloacimonetes bacterium]|nr:hypothetical protein [Candidatus Cloacimonadota bacterium]